MDGSIALGPGRRKRLLAVCRKATDPQARLRAHIILLLADGHAWAVIAAVLFCSTATIARWLRSEGMVWRRPRPVPGPTDPRRVYKLRRIRELLRDLPADEAAVFQDEVDLNLNPEIGCMWMPRGEQA